MMRNSFMSALVVVTSLPSLAYSEQSNMETAAMQMALAANCRANYGDHDLFEVAFKRFQELAFEEKPDLSAKEIDDMRQTLYEIEAETGNNPFLKGFCDKLKEHFDLPK